MEGRPFPSDMVRKAVKTEAFADDPNNLNTVSLGPYKKRNSYVEWRIEACGVVIPPFCRCAAAALVAKCGAAAQRREEQFFRRSRNTHTYSLDHRMWQQGYHQGYAIPEW